MAKQIERNRRRVEAEESAVLDMQFSILDLMEEQGVTQEELAERMGISKSRVSQLFAAGANPTLKSVVRIYDALDHKIEVRARSYWQEEAPAVTSHPLTFGSFIIDTNCFEFGRSWVADDSAANENYAEASLLAEQKEAA